MKEKVDGNLIIQAKVNNPCATLEQVGSKFGITRERVRQILKRAGTSTTRYNYRAKMTCPRCGQKKYSASNYCPKCYRGLHNVTLQCINCGTYFERNQSQFLYQVNNPRYKGHFFCNRKCLGKYIGNNYGWGNPNHPIHTTQLI